jgi:hypothetical protein
MALSKARLLEKLSNTPVAQMLDLPVATGVTIHQGALVVMQGGFARPGFVSTTAVAAGVLEEGPSIVAAAAGSRVKVKRGIFKMKNSAAGDLITEADLLQDCFIVDDETVAKTNGTNTRSKAGRVMKVDADGVFVAIGVND